MTRRMHVSELTLTDFDDCDAWAFSEEEEDEDAGIVAPAYSENIPYDSEEFDSVFIKCKVLLNDGSAPIDAVASVRVRDHYVYMLELYFGGEARDMPLQAQLREPEALADVERLLKRSEREILPLRVIADIKSIGLSIDQTVPFPYLQKDQPSQESRSRGQGTL